MAIAAALNILVTSPTEQLRSDLKASGLTVSQFSRHITTMFGKASQKAKDDIKKMGAAVNIALAENVIKAKEHAEAMNVLGNAYTYVHNGGESFAKMMQDAAAITAKHSDGTTELIQRLKQLDAMYKANKISAAAYRKEVAALHTTQVTANFGSEVSKIAARNDPHGEFLKERRVLQRAWAMQAITDEKKYFAELEALSKKHHGIGTYQGPTSSPVGDRLARMTGMDAAAAAAAKKQQDDQAAAQAAKDKIDQAFAKAMQDQATSLNTKNMPAIDAYNARVAHLKTLLQQSGLQQHAFNAEMQIAQKTLEDHAGITKINADAEAKRQADVAKGSSLNAAHMTTFDQMAKSMTDLQALEKQGVLDPGVYEKQRDVIMGVEAERQKAITKRTELEGQANQLNKQSLTTFEQMAAEMEHLNELKKHGLSDAAFTKQRDVITGATASDLAKEAAQKEGLARVESHRNDLLSEANALNGAWSTSQEVFNQRVLKLNALRATGALTERAYREELKKTTAALRQQTSVMTKMGFSMHGLKAAMGLFNPWLVASMAAGALVKDAMDFEKAMSRVKAISGATAAEMNVLTTAAMEMGRVTIHTSTQAAEGLAAFAQAGFTTQEAIDSLRATLRLATIGEMEVADAAEIAARIMAGMNIPATQFADTVDKIAMAASASLTSVEDLGNALKFVGPVAAQAGISIEETLAALMTMSAAGLQGELGGTALRNSLLKMSKQSEEAKKTMEDLRITFRDAAGDLLPLVQIIGQLEVALKDMGSAEKLEVLNKLFEARAVVGVTSLVNSGAQNFQERTALLEESAGVSKAMETAITDNLWGDLELLGSQIAQLATDIYNSGLGWILRDLVQRVTAIANLFQMLWSMLKVLFFAIGNLFMQLIADIASWSKMIDPTSTSSDIEAWAKQKQKESAEAVNSNLDGAMSARSDMVKNFTHGSVDLNPDGEYQANMEELKARMEEIKQELANESAALSPDEQEALVLQQERLQVTQELLGDMEKITGELKDQIGQVEHGAEAWLRIQFEQKIALETDAKRKEMLEDQLDLLEEQQDLLHSAKWNAAGEDAQDDLRRVRMTEGEKAYEDIYGRGSSDNNQYVKEDTLALDSILGQIEAEKHLLAAEQERKRLQEELDLKNGGMDRDFDKYDTIEWENAQRIGADHMVTAEEEAQHHALLDQHDAIRAINAELEKRKKTEADLKKSQEDLKKHAQDLQDDAAALIQEMNPIEKWMEEFEKIETMLKTGLIDEETAGKAQQELLNKTLKSAGPKNIALAGAVTEDSAEGYSAKLPTFKNPEYEELKAQTKLAAKSLDVQNRIDKGVQNFNAGKKLIDLGP